MKFAIKIFAAGFVYLAVLAAYAQEKKEDAPAVPVKDVEGVIRRVIEGVKPGAPAATKPGEKKKEEEVEIPRAPLPELGPRFIRLHLQDGSVISGDLSVSEVAVETQFGKLTVPISKLRSFTPGLDSNKKAAEQIKALVEKLGGDDYKTREQAHKELAGMGVRIRKELDKHVGSENAELAEPLEGLADLGVLGGASSEADVLGEICEVHDGVVRALVGRLVEEVEGEDR